MTSPHDAFVRRALELVPELAEQPEWVRHQSWPRAHGLTGERLTLQSIGHVVLAPFLWRLLERPQPREDPVLSRSLALLEELLDSEDQAAQSSARHHLEHSVLRHPRNQAVEVLLGPRSRTVLESLRSAFAPFEPAWERLKPCFDGIIATVQARFPDISAGSSYSLGAPGAFMAQASFSFDPASQRYDDLVLAFRVLPARLSSWTPAAGDGQPRDALEFVIERGTGHRLAALERRTLGAEPGSPAYRQGLLTCADEAVALVKERNDLIVEALSEPYNPWRLARPDEPPARRPRLSDSAAGKRLCEQARAELEAAYSAVIAAAQAKEPRMAGQVLVLPAEDGPLHVRAELIFDEATENQGVLLLDFVLADAGCFHWCEERAPRVFPGVFDRDAVGFKVTPAACYIAPLVLPEDGRSDEQEDVLMGYVKRATAYIEQHVGLMLAVLENERRGASSHG